MSVQFKVKRSARNDDFSFRAAERRLFLSSWFTYWNILKVPITLLAKFRVKYDIK